MHKGRKLCGILVQTERAEDDKLGVVIGVGMNLRVAPIIEGYPTVALPEISTEAKKLDAEALLRKLNGHLDGVLDLWREKPFADIAKAWLKRAYGRDRVLHATHDGADISGTLLGLDDIGALQIQTQDGVVAISNGDVTYGERLAVGN
jgi:BirA family biotin operon repressor/biotin-[acetyl-CoA-carboxylase] ligase